VKLATDEIDVPEVLDIDGFRLRQIVLNLLSNAIKFTEKGQISVLSAWHDGELKISVADTGPGMPEAAVKRLFTAFQQADGSVAARHGGTGLGLTISRNLARLMGGDITVNSTLGQGTVFMVTIKAPLVAAHGAERRVEPRGDETVRNVLHGMVLVAEDMPDTRALVVRHLEQLGLTVLQAENGEQAIEIALAKRPDVVLMDMEMPVVAGGEATRTLRMCGFSAPILALTARKDEEGRLRALASGCNGLIEKPLTRSSLLVPLAAALAPLSKGAARAA
jgi:two-component system, sensor histidine kinase